MRFSFIFKRIFMFSRENLVSWRAGSCLHESFGASVEDELARGRAP